MSHIKIYLTNLGKYNEGELIGEWVDLPVDEYELQEVFKRIGISDEPDEFGNYYEEYFITDYESDIPGFYVDEYENLDHLNEVAEEVDNLTDSDLEIFKNAVEAGFIDSDDITDFDPDRYILYSGVETRQDLGYEMVELYGGIENLSQETLQDNFDFESYGRDERIYFDAANWLDVDTEDEEEVARVCEEYGVTDIADIDIYKCLGVSDDKEVGEYFVYEIDGGIENLSKDTLERYFDYESYASNIVNANVGAFTEDGFIEDTER